MELITLTREQYSGDIEEAYRRGADYVLSKLDERPAAPPSSSEWLETRAAAKYINRSARYLREKAAEKGTVLVRRKGAGRRPDAYQTASLDAFLAAQHD